MYRYLPSAIHMIVHLYSLRPRLLADEMTMVAAVRRPSDRLVDPSTIGQHISGTFALLTVPAGARAQVTTGVDGWMDGWMTLAASPGARVIGLDRSRI